MADAVSSATPHRKKPIMMSPSKDGSAGQSKLPRRPTPAPFQLRRDVAFCIFFASHLIAAIYHPIQDCDEVYNYWEPTHYLNHGYGFQTWEHSPVYAIRSWAYAGLHALLTLAGAPAVALAKSKVPEFYFLRALLGFVCALCETRLFSKIAATLNPRVAITFLLVMATSPGMFHASVAYLPSSFAMYATMLGIAAFMDWKTAQGIFAIGTGAVLGWPFAAAMAIPFLLEEVLYAALDNHDSIIERIQRIAYGTIRTFLVLVGQIAVDAFFYKKLVVVPFNIVWYNVFSGGGGPDLYGTEPWHFYLRNLFLNFHVWLLLALASMPLWLIQYCFHTRNTTRTTHLRQLVFLSPFYVWLAIFMLQPHKEERFIYPAYPALALNAAVSLHIILASLGSTDKRDVISKIPVQLRLFFILAFVLSTLAFSTFRTIGTITAYNAPLSIYKPLHDPSIADQETTVCLGKEWYRFPSHYLLPATTRAKLIKSEFSGLLPGEFHEGTTSSAAGLGLFPGTWLEPPGMNNLNREDPGKYTELKHCNFLVDVRLPSTTPTPLEPDFLADAETWERVRCLPFLDAAATGVVGRMGWVPEWPIVPRRFQRVWGEYCLLKRRKRKVALHHHRDPVPQIETLS